MARDYEIADSGDNVDRSASLLLAVIESPVHDDQKARTALMEALVDSQQLYSALKKPNGDDLTRLTRALFKKITPIIARYPKVVQEVSGLPLPDDIQAGASDVKYLGSGRETGVVLLNGNEIVKIPLDQLKQKLSTPEARQASARITSQLQEHRQLLAQYFVSTAKYCLGDLAIPCEIEPGPIIRQPFIDALEETFTGDDDKPEDPLVRFLIRQIAITRRGLHKDNIEWARESHIIDTLLTVPPSQLRAAATNLLRGVLLGYVPDIHVIQRDFTVSSTSLLASLVGVDKQSEKLLIYDFGDPTLDHFSLLQRQTIETQIAKQGGINNTLIISAEGNICFAEWYTSLLNELVKEKKATEASLTQYTNLHEYDPIVLKDFPEKFKGDHERIRESFPKIWLTMRSDSFLLLENLRKTESIPISEINDIEEKLVTNPLLTLIDRPVTSEACGVVMKCSPQLRKGLSDLIIYSRTISTAQASIGMSEAYIKLLEQGINLDNVAPVAKGDNSHPVISAIQDAMLLYQIAKYLEAEAS